VDWIQNEIATTGQLKTFEEFGRATAGSGLSATTHAREVPEQNRLIRRAVRDAEPLRVEDKAKYEELNALRVEPRGQEQGQEKRSRDRSRLAA